MHRSRARCRLVQRFERIVQGAAAADGVTVRVFVAQNQNVVRSQQALRHLLHIQLFCHPMIHPFRKAELFLGLGSGCASSLAVHVQAAQQLVDVGCIGGTVVLHKDEAGCLADVHFLAHFGAHMACGAVQRLDGGLGAVLRGPSRSHTPLPHPGRASRPDG